MESKYSRDTIKFQINVLKKIIKREVTKNIKRLVKDKHIEGVAILGIRGHKI